MLLVSDCDCLREFGIFGHLVAGISVELVGLDPRSLDWRVDNDLRINDRLCGFMVDCLL